MCAYLACEKCSPHQMCLGKSLVSFFPSSVRSTAKTKKRETVVANVVKQKFRLFVRQTKRTTGPGNTGENYGKQKTYVMRSFIVMPKVSKQNTIFEREMEFTYVDGAAFLKGCCAFVSRQCHSQWSVTEQWVIKSFCGTICALVR